MERLDCFELVWDDRLGLNWFELVHGFSRFWYVWMDWVHGFPGYALINRFTPHIILIINHLSKMLNNGMFHQGGRGVRTKFHHYYLFLRSFLIQCLLSPKPNQYDVLQKAGKTHFFGSKWGTTDFWFSICHPFQYSISHETLNLNWQQWIL